METKSELPNNPTVESLNGKPPQQKDVVGQVTGSIVFALIEQSLQAGNSITLPDGTPLLTPLSPALEEVSH